jgi:hypothetical protein
MQLSRTGTSTIAAGTMIHGRNTRARGRFLDWWRAAGRCLGGMAYASNSSMLRTTHALLAVVDPARTDANTMAATWRCSVVNLIFFRVKLVAETTGQARGERHTRRRTSERVHCGHHTAGRSRRFEGALGFLHCRRPSVPLAKLLWGWALPLTLRKLAGMLHCRRR